MTGSLLKLENDEGTSLEKEKEKDIQGGKKGTPEQI